MLKRIILVILFAGIVALAAWRISLAIDWHKRLAEANQSVLFGQMTNGYRNDFLIATARQYLAKITAVTFDGTTIATDDNRLVHIGFTPAWFASHAPESISYNNHTYDVYWMFLPGCEKRPADKVSKPNWFDQNDRQCLGGYGVQVFFDDSLQPAARVWVGTLL